MARSIEDIRSIILNTVANAADLNPDEIGPDQELIHDLNLDSLAVYEIVVDLETAFGLQIADEDVEKLHTVDDIAAYVKANLKN